MEASKKVNMKRTGEGSGKPGKSLKKKKNRSVLLRPGLNEESLKQSLKEHWAERQSYTSEDNLVELHDNPFKLCVLHKFIHDDSFLEDLGDELSDLEYRAKNNDLYQFHQSDDLASISTPNIVALQKFLFTDFVVWLRETTGLPLLEKVDVTCSRYDYTDVLLCHDDRCEGRKIAFILYLSRNWSKKDGGTLDMFDRDENGQPKSVVHSIVPTWNSFAFFEVTNQSFHQVSEVLTEDKTRVAVSGWFHAPTSKFPLYKEAVIYQEAPVSMQVDLKKWINSSYLASDTQEGVKNFFSENSEIRLTDFFLPEKFQEVSEALLSPDINWELKGPANMRHYRVSRTNTLPVCVMELMQLLKSEKMFQLLSSMTELDFDTLKAPEDVSRCWSEVQQWEQGCYTLMHNDSAIEENCLEMMVHLNCESLSQEDGGFTTYIAKDDDEELLTIYPISNSLSLTYKDKETLGFVKYINNRFKGRFHTLSFLYYESS